MIQSPDLPTCRLTAALTSKQAINPQNQIPKGGRARAVRFQVFPSALVRLVIVASLHGMAGRIRLAS
jgi:hypothetical protein